MKYVQCQWCKFERALNKEEEEENEGSHYCDRCGAWTTSRAYERSPRKLVLSFEIPPDQAEELEGLMAVFHGNLHYLLADALAEFSKSREVNPDRLDFEGAEDYVSRRYDSMNFFRESEQGRKERQKKVREVAARCRASEILRNHCLDLRVDTIGVKDEK